MGGKIKATAQFVVVTCYMFLAFVETEFLTSKVTDAIAIIRFVLMILLVATTILTIYTGASYLIRNRKVFIDKPQTEEKVTEEVVVSNEETSNEEIEVEDKE